MSLTRLLATLSLVVVPIVAVADLGSVVVVQMTVPDDAAEAGRAGVQAIGHSPTGSAATAANAEIAYAAASSVAELHRQKVDPQTFTVFKDGSVQLTVRRTAPTVLFKRLPGLRNLASSESTMIVPPIHY